MSAFEPSLFAICKQTRATVSADANNPKRRQEQKERVAVAMLGFALKHQDDFRSAFLRAMCDYDPKEPSTWTVELEITDCGDLAVRSKDFVAVFELKIEAPLDSHQWPDAKGGYRENMDAVFAHLPRRKYVVVQKELPLRSAPESFKTWHDVRDAGEAARSPLIVDLFEVVFRGNDRCAGRWAGVVFSHERDALSQMPASGCSQERPRRQQRQAELAVPGLRAAVRG